MIKHELRYDRINITLDETWDNKTLQDFFDFYYISSKNRYQYLQNGRILINRKKVADPSTLLHKKDILSILFEEEDYGFLPAEKECKIIYEDDFVYVAHKDPGMIIHGDYDDTNCLANLAACYQKNHNLHTPVRYIHRLDKDTAGLVLFVKIPFFQAFYDQLLSEKKIQRHYYAISFGEVALNKKLHINRAIGKDRHVNGKYRVSKTGKPATTDFICVEKHGKYVLMSCDLQTGRTHQIRVHLASMQLPIINDPLYGIMDAKYPHMGLWADEIRFVDPLNFNEIIVQDELNPMFAQFQTIESKKGRK